MNFGALAASDFSKSKVSVYPNPFNENLNISTENGGLVHFYDLSGKLVFNISFDERNEFFEQILACKRCLHLSDKKHNWGSSFFRKSN